MTTPANLPDAMRARRDTGQALLDATVAFHRAWERCQEAREEARETHRADGIYSDATHTLAALLVSTVDQAEEAVDAATTAYIAAVNAEMALARYPGLEGA